MLFFWVTRLMNMMLTNFDSKFILICNDLTPCVCFTLLNITFLGIQFYILYKMITSFAI